MLGLGSIGVFTATHRRVNVRINVVDAAARRTGRSALRVAASSLTMAVLLTASGTASAHMDESQQAKLLVLQSISLIANNAPPDAIVQHLNDALAAPDKSGVDRAKVEEALALITGSHAADSHATLGQARELLVGAIALRAASGYGAIPEPGQVGQDMPPYATGVESGTTVVLDELHPARGVSDGGDVALLVIALLMVAGGLYLSRRWRPQDSIHRLRQLSIDAGRLESS